MLIRLFVIGLILGFAVGLAFAAPEPAAPEAPTPQRAKSFAVVGTETHDAATLTARLGDRNEAIWLDDDVLWIVRRGSEGPWSTIGSISQPLTHIAGTDLWATGLRWDRWAQAFVRVAFTSPELPSRAIEYIVWRGERAPTRASQAEPGLVESIQLPSPVEGSERTITVVLPPGHRAGDPIPAIVLADGQSAETWGRVIAALCLEGKARPVALVGVHSGKYEGDRSKPYDPHLDIRAREYLEGYDPERFAAHLDWLIDVVLPEIARRYPISLERENLAVAGFSNGGAFAASAALRRGDVFGMALALSIGVPPDIEAAPKPPKARFYLAAGELERRFLEHTAATHDQINAAGGEAVFVSFVAGHDSDMWTLAAARLIPEMFPTTRADADAGAADR